MSDAFAQEQSKLITLSANPYVTDEREEVRVGKTPYVRFDLNDYSVPHTAVRRSLTVSATPDKVFILEGLNIIAEHQRSYDKGRQIECAEHIAQLIAWKNKAKQHSGQNRLTKILPLLVMS